MSRFQALGGGELRPEAAAEHRPLQVHSSAQDPVLRCSRDHGG